MLQALSQQGLKPLLHVYRILPMVNSGLVKKVLPVLWPNEIGSLSAVA